MKKILFFYLIYLITLFNISGLISNNEDSFSFNKSLSAIKVISSFNAYNTSSIAAEIFGQTTQYRSPIVEAAGSGKASQMFCSDNYSLIFMSRKIKQSEIKQCQMKKTGDIVEIVLGYDSIIFAHNKNADDISLTYQELYLAMINQVFDNGRLITNSHKKWNQISEELPNNKIKIYGPTAGSGTRDVFIDQVIKPKCMSDINIFNNNKFDALEEFCKTIRNDEHYIDHGDDYITLIKKMQLDSNIIGIINFYVLQQNQHQIKSIKINNIEPNEENIISGLYNISLPIVIYFKKNHMKNDLKNFIQDITSSKALGKNGYLTKIGINGKKVIDLKEIKINS